MEFALCELFSAPLEYRGDDYVFAFEALREGAEAEILHLCHSLEGGIECRIRWVKKAQADWLETYRQSVQPVCCGGFRVRPSWHAQKPGEATDLIIDPGLVFGTGHHETTCGCLEAIGRLSLKEKSVLDVGCGSGILGIAAALRGAAASLCDTDEAAIIDTLHNCNINGVQAKKMWVGSTEGTEETYDVVIANIVADVIVGLRPELGRVTKNGGTLILSGILTRYRSRIESAFGAFETLFVIERGEWLTFALRKKDRE